jgi:hypothetical protein
MRRARVALVACLSLTVMMLPGTVGARQQVAAQSEPTGGWFSLPYFQSGYGWFRIPTNSETFGAARIVNATPLSTPYPGPTQEEGQGKVLESIWSTKCKKAAQKVTFERKVFLPGVPDVLQASLFSQTISSYAPAPIKSIALKVNGTTVLDHGNGEVPTYASRTLTDISSLGDEFVYGENTITVVAKKKNTKKPHPVAGAYCEGDNRFGVAVELYGEFTADVATTGPVAGGTTDGTSNAAVIPITITNNGPTDLFTGAGQFNFAASSNQATITHVIAGVDNGGNFVVPGCTQDSSYSDGRGVGLRAICPLPRLEPGQSLSFKVVVGFESFDCADKIYFNYGTPGYFESTETTADNGSTERGLERRC